MVNYFLKLKSWELFLMIVLPLALSYFVGLEFNALLIGSIVLFMALQKIHNAD